MKKIKLGDSLPAIEIAATGDKTITLSNLRNKNIVLYFYPKDSTPGCTLEGQDFRDNIAKFSRNKTLIFGVSRDSVKSHERFKDTQDFPFELLSDEDEKLCQAFNVIKMKNMYGKQVKGIERSTFLFDTKGTLVQEWRGVKVDGHVAEVLAQVRALNK